MPPTRRPREVGEEQRLDAEMAVAHHGPERSRMMKARTLALLVAALVLPAAAARADEVVELIDTLKPSPLDYAVWAGKILNAVGDLPDNPAARARLYEKAYEFGMKRAEGYPAAIQAARALMTARPDQGAAWQQKLLAVVKLDWQAADRERKPAAGRAYVEQMLAMADDLAASGHLDEAVRLFTDASRMVRTYAPDRADWAARRLKDIQDRGKLLQQVAQCKRALGAKPGDVAVRERLILLYVVEAGEPGRARELLTPDVSERLRTYVPLAAKEVDQVAKEVCLELGDWYVSLAVRATPGAKARALARAKAYYEQFVELEDSAVKRSVGKAKLTQVETQLRQLGGSGPAGDKQIVLDLGKGVELKLVRIPSGVFAMGSPAGEPGRGSDGREGPQHKVTISRAFHIGVTEVTVGQFTAFVAATRYKTQAERDGHAFVWRNGWQKASGMSWRKPGFERTDKHPVVCVSWNDAVAFCKWVRRKTRRPVRLPTEAEWEYACRAGTKTAFSFGGDEKDLDGYGWHEGNSEAKAQPVAQKKPNPAGLHDMHGNVWEWCLDRHEQGYYATRQAGGPTGPT
jgi:formylglycine-generating enzyme required for sulfatase activity